MSAFQHLQGDEPGIGRALPPLYNRVYCSRATAGVDDAAVQRIVRDANRASDVIARIRGFFRRGEGLPTPVDVDGVIAEVHGPADRMSSAYRRYLARLGVLLGVC